MPAVSVEKLTQDLLRDRERAKARSHTARPRPPHGTFDPFAVDWSRAAVIAGPAPGYLPSMPVRQGTVGFHVACRACGIEFESKGMAYCSACLALPADERRAMKPAFKGRLCQAPSCENFIPRKARADVAYCSRACQQRAYRARRVMDNPAALPDTAPPQNVMDSDQKEQ
jgi:hypothetical protein